MKQLLQQKMFEKKLILGPEVSVSQSEILIVVNLCDPTTKLAIFMTKICNSTKVVTLQ